MLGRLFSHEKIGGWQNNTLLGKMWGFANNTVYRLDFPTPSGEVKHPWKGSEWESKEDGVMTGKK
jgi:hypothetical protein